LEVEIAHSDSLIEKQKDLLEEKNKEIEDLKRRLSEVESRNVIHSYNSCDDQVYMRIKAACQAVTISTTNNEALLKSYSCAQ
jgi:hypothetical protein